MLSVSPPRLRTLSLHTWCSCPGFSQTDPIFLEVELGCYQWQTRQNKSSIQLLCVSCCEVAFSQQHNITDSGHMHSCALVHPRAFTKTQLLSPPNTLYLYCEFYCLKYLFQTTSIFQNNFVLQSCPPACVLYKTPTLSSVQIIKYWTIPDTEVLAQIYLSFSLEVWFPSQLYNNFTVISIKLFP